MTASLVYTGNLRCSVEHIQSGTIIETDAPTDNKGKGERFSPGFPPNVPLMPEILFINATFGII